MLETGNGPISVSGASITVHAAATNGGIVARNVKGIVTFLTTKGDVTVRRMTLKPKSLNLIQTQRGAISIQGLDSAKVDGRKAGISVRGHAKKGSFTVYRKGTTTIAPRGEFLRGPSRAILSLLTLNGNVLVQ